MKEELSSDDKITRGFLFFCGAVLAVPSCLFWKEVIVGHQWPEGLNGWLGLILMPTFSIVSFVYAIFYRRVKAIDDRLEVAMNSKTRSDKKLHDFLMKNNLRWLDKLLFKDTFDEE